MPIQPFSCRTQEVRIIHQIKRNKGLHHFFSQWRLFCCKYRCMVYPQPPLSSCAHAEVYLMYISNEAGAQIIHSNLSFFQLLIRKHTTDLLWVELGFFSFLFLSFFFWNLHLSSYYCICLLRWVLLSVNVSFQSAVTKFYDYNKNRMCFYHTGTCGSVELSRSYVWRSLHHSLFTVQTGEQWKRWVLCIKYITKM